MRIIRDFSACPAPYKNSVVALGNFDGVHLGHQEILRHCIATAKADRAPAAVMTFEPHPREFFSKTGEKLRIYPLCQKIELLRNSGIDVLFLVRFNRRFSSQSARDFIENVLHRQLAVRHVVTGYNFAFGKNREGDTAFLDKVAAQLGMGYTACPKVFDRAGEGVSSSAIRALLAAGDVARASALLGRPYRIEGRVRRGEQRGRTLGFPTANLSLSVLFKPRFGIYAVRASVGNNGVWHDAVASLGVNPMFPLAQPLLEVHILGSNQDIYGRRLKVEFAGYIREEKHFDGVEALCAQMADDSRKAKEILNVCSA